MPETDMSWKPVQPLSRSTQLETRINELRDLLRDRNPGMIAQSSGSKFNKFSSSQGEICVPFWEIELKISWPELAVRDDKDGSMPSFFQGLLFYYLSTADGTPISNTWVSFADLSGGRTYAPAFEGYSGMELAKKFSSDAGSFERSCILTGGQRVDFADVSFGFKLFPRFPLLAAFWLGDSEFPSTFKILFDRSAIHYLPIDACAVAGSLLAKRIISNS